MFGDVKECFFRWGIANGIFHENRNSFEDVECIRDVYFKYKLSMSSLNREISTEIYVKCS